MAEKYRGSRLAPAAAPGRLAGVATQALADYRRGMDAFALEQGAASAFRIIDAANEYIAETEPWKLDKDEASAGRLSQVLFDVAEAVRVAGILLLPIMPASAAEILRRVGETTPAESIRLENAAWRNQGERVIHKGNALWPRAEAADKQPRINTDKQVRQNTRSNDVSEDKTPAPASGPAPAPPSAPTATPAPTPAPAPADNRISIDDFLKIDLRVAKVLTAEKVPNSRKLMKLSIDVGTEHRTLVAGIAEAYEPEQLVGKTVGIVFNLKPAKLMGIESNGMILAASPEGGKPVLVAFDGDIPPGSRIR
jgi:methionyl-tRNA synthetase